MSATETDGTDAVSTPTQTLVADDVVPTSRTGALIGMGGLVLVVVILLAFALFPRYQDGATSVGDGQLSATATGEIAPDFTGALVGGGGDLTLSSLRGKTVVVNFWASWCGTCQAEAQTVADVEKQWRDKGVVFLGVDSHDTTAGAATYIEKYGLGYRSVQDPDQRIGASYRVTGLPETFFLDTQGRVVAKHVSSIDASTLSSLVQQAVAAG